MTDLRVRVHVRLEICVRELTAALTCVAGVPSRREIAGLAGVVLVAPAPPDVAAKFQACCVCGPMSATCWPWYWVSGLLAMFWASA